MSAPPFPTIVRVVNTGATDFMIYFQRSFACPLGFMIRGDTPAGLSSTSIEQPDTTCDCATCGQGVGGGPRCISNDLLCDDRRSTVPPGGTFDFSWDGTVLTWFDAGTREASCPIRCSRFTAVPAGTYVFSLVQPAGTFEASPTALPASGGVVESRSARHEHVSTVGGESNRRHPVSACGACGSQPRQGAEDPGNRGPARSTEAGLSGVSRAPGGARNTD